MQMRRKMIVQEIKRWKKKYIAHKIRQKIFILVMKGKNESEVCKKKKNQKCSGTTNFRMWKFKEIIKDARYKKTTFS